MTSVSNNFLRFGVLALICGVSLGAWMGANENFTLKSVHAHINLVGWASMMIYGLFYRVFPDAARGWMPVTQFFLSVIGFIAMITGLAALMLNNPTLLPVLMAGEIMTLISILLFAIILFIATGKKA